MRRPAGDAGDDKQRGEHFGRDAHHVVGNRREPVEVREHLFGIPHYLFQTVGDVVHFQRAAFLGKLLRHALDHLMPRVSKGVDRVTKANHHLFVFYTFTDISFGFIRGFVALLNFQRHFVRPAVFRTA
ncbi:hypothetical protein D3C73_1145960 [compost metagenome]